jgi:UDP-N-acetylmuramate: L-alanyl-gamma-D-glutamyl-meso-diaminopimelate ligase
MKVHFIAIGGSAMHNLAIALHQKAYTISGSDDEIFEPSRARLNKYGLLPEKFGWHPEKITTDLDAIILGMHARKDNPELARAQELGLKIYSYPEFLYEQSQDKKRVVIAGSHGKTTITAMIMHVLQVLDQDFDFMVGAQLEGFEVMVKITENAEIMLFEGDEYLTSPMDLRPKFHLYKPHIALISGIAWDHINVFPTFDIYVDQFRKFVDMIEPNGSLVYYQEDEEIKSLVGQNKHIKHVPYSLPEHTKEDTRVSLVLDGKQYPLHIFGKHNLENINGAMKVCGELGISEHDFASAISSFKGASKRLQLIDENEHTSVYLDFAHAPSKLKATVAAVKSHFGKRKLIACMELHTFSSLSEEFLEHYSGAMDMADHAYVYFSPHTLALKKLPEISIEQVKQAFGREDLKVFNDSALMMQDLLQQEWADTNLLLMSSGNFDGWDPQDIADRILKS